MKQRHVICLSCGRRFTQTEFAEETWTNRQCLACGSGFLTVVCSDGQGGLYAGEMAGDGELAESTLDNVDDLLPPPGPGAVEWEGM